MGSVLQRSLKRSPQPLPAAAHAPEGPGVSSSSAAQSANTVGAEGPEVERLVERDLALFISRSSPSKSNRSSLLYPVTGGGLTWTPEPDAELEDPALFESRSASLDRSRFA